jgi:chlorobactene glucosyltransferase
VGIIVAAILLLCEALLLRRAIRQRGALDALIPHAMPFEAYPPTVAIIVPARNEAFNIGPCLDSLLAQAYPAKALQLVAVDDESEDSTTDILAAYGRTHSRMTVVPAAPLAMGWTGKNQACWRGAQAVPRETDWLCFIDADMRADPCLIASAVVAAERGSHLLSLAPQHKLVSFAERLMIPCGLYLLSFKQDLIKVQAARWEAVSVTGQFMLIDRVAYEAVGGHAAVAGAICEDLELARLMKRSGFSVVLMDGASLLSTRMYDGWSTLWPGFAKNVLDTFGGVGPAFATAAAAIVLSWSIALAPVIDYALCSRGSPLDCAALGLVGVAAMIAVGFHVAGSVYFGLPPWYGLLFPVGYALGGLIALHGLRSRATRRIVWKGRIYR